MAEANQQQEYQNVEWKRSWLDNYMKWICGFANAQGGRLVIGVDEDGEFAGLEGARKLLEELPNKLRDQLGLMTRRRESVGKTAERVLDLCEANPMMTMLEMAKGIDVSERSIERKNSNLQDWNLLRRVGGRKEGRWEVIQNESNP